ncbi:MAG TPA: hypothetical protein VMW89_08550 [Desulfatiglandales bacterium]|nr:hypothetical protein [Desulfatiglandales bacterium]
MTDHIAKGPFFSVAKNEPNKGFTSSDPCPSTPLSMFIPEENVIEFCCQMLGSTVDVTKLKYIISLGLLPVYKSDKKNLILKTDLVSLFDLLILPDKKEGTRLRYERLFEQDSLRISSCTVIDLVHEASATVPTLFSASRNLISAHKFLETDANKDESTILYFSGSRLTTLSKKVLQFAEAQLARERKVDMSATSQFAQSAHYMGSKRTLCGFLVEAISSVLPETGVVIDLMCGSGVASGAFSKTWRTFASDAQEFCRTLAVVHGGGFDRLAGQKLVSKILPVAKEHFNSLQRIVADAIETEDNLFCRDTDESLLHDYKDFLRAFPTLPNEMITKRWNPQAEVRRRKENRLYHPYCLFTAYFSNVYFGVRQCVEIDSVRFSIDQLRDNNEKNWAMGALLATVSALGTTYGGHFAQPLIRDCEDISLGNLSTVIHKRSSSITHEFIVRLLNLAEESQKSSRRIEVVPGPWENALSILGETLRGELVVVYLDAPYKREEYSRYYHVLETLVSYAYPSCTGIGLTPKPGDRFRSEFFTKVERQVTRTLVSIITKILERGWICAWSYSDSGVANICDVIKSVHQKITCDVRSYSAPSVHKSQGGAKPKRVTEYLMILSPKK